MERSRRPRHECLGKRSLSRRLNYAADVKTMAGVLDVRSDDIRELPRSRGSSATREAAKCGAGKSHSTIAPKKPYTVVRDNQRTIEA